MNHLSPSGPVYQAGTLSANPAAVAAGIATLEQLKHCDYVELEKQSKGLMEGLEGLAKKYRVPFQASYAGGMFGFFFTNAPVCSYQDIDEGHQQRFTYFHQNMLAQGIYFAPSAYEAGFLSFCHGQEECEMTLAAASNVFKQRAQELS